MNKIFKTKYDVTTGQTKAVSELANNRQVASSSEKLKCGGFLGYALGLFKLAPLALLVCGLLPSVGQAADVWLLSKDDLNKNGNGGLHEGTGIMYDQGKWGYQHNINDGDIKSKESTLLTSGRNRTGAETQLRNKDFWRTVAIGSRAVVGGNDTTAIGYKAIVGINSKETKNRKEDSHQGTAVGYRAFSYGLESVSLGNDTVAYGASSISIGSDNVGQSKSDTGTINNPYSQKALSYDIWDLFHTHGSKFNYTSEYAATKNYSQNNGDKKTLYQQYLKMNGSEPAYKTHNWAYGDSSIAIGSRNVAFGHSSLAIGTSSIARGNYSTALGTGTLAFGNSAVAVGNEVFVYNDAGVAVGNNIQSLAKGSIVYGYISYAGGEGSVAIGTRASAGVEVKGEHFNLIGSSHDRVVLEEMYNGNADDSRDKTYEKLSKLDTNKENLYKVKADQQDGTGEEKAKANGATGGVAIGYYVIANGENSLALGRQAYATGKSSVAMGPYAYAKDENTVAIGYAAKAIGKESFAIGSYSRADGKNSIALGIGSKVLNDAVNNNLNGENSLALGNETEVKMQNSVALGYKSTTNYFYKDDNKSAATLMGEDAIELPSYFPKGSSYKVDVSDADGVVSVGGWNKSGKVGFRRIVNAAPGALDSDVATVGQLKALYYVKKEGPMVYYTEEGGKQIKLVKDADGKFYKVNTDNGEPMKNSKEIPKENVLIGAKGANEVIEPTTKLANIGEKIKFGHLANGKIADNSDQAITGHQLKNVGDILGISINANNTKFDNPSFAAVKYVGETNGTQSNFKGVIDELITAVNKGYNFSDGISSKMFNLGSTITIKADNISTTHKSTNLKVQLDKSGNTATFKIGMTDTPTFTNVTINQAPTDKNHVVNKKYVDDKLKDAGKSHYLSVNEPALKAGNYNNDGAKAQKAIAIGVDVEAGSNAESAVLIGNNLNTDINHSVIIGSNMNIEQDNANAKKDAVVAIGSGLKLKNAKSSIVLGAVDERQDTSNSENSRTAVIDASWAVVIGNKTKIKDGTDIVALGNNIDVSGRNNNSLVILGNQAQASNAENSVVLGKEAHVQTQNVVALGYKAKAETTATGGVALGQQATVRKSNGIALGSNSVANTDANIVGLNTVTGANHKNASAYGAWKSRYGALSIGNGNDTRQITGLAAGKQDTDAVNVAQLKEATTHFVSINGGNNSDGNYANNGATKKGAVAIGIGTQAESDGAVSIGYGTQVLSGSNNSIAIGAVNENGSKTKIENAAWAVAIGNKTSITAGNDIVAIGNNMTVNKASGNNEVNSSLVIIGNATKATNAKSSVVIGHGATAKNVNEVVVIGKDANVEANAIGAVAIGEGASVATAAGDSIALGKGSQATTKETAQGNATVEGVKFNFEAGKGDNKTVLSIGKAGTERIIKHVAAGKVSSDSTDAINGSQLFGVTKEFSKLALEVLGAEKADNGNAGFKKSEFEIAKYNGNTNNNKAMTFRDAIGQNTTAINKGLLISDGGTTGGGTLQLGDTLKIKAGNMEVTEPILNTKTNFKSDNIRTSYSPGNKELLIGIKENPNFKSVTVDGEINKDTPENTLITKKYVDEKLATKAGTFKVTSDKGETNDITGTLGIKGKQETANANHKNISTEATGTDLTIVLNSDLKNISSIGKDDKAKITFNSNGTKDITFRVDNATYKFDSNGLSLGDKKITGVASGIGDVANTTNLDNVLKGTPDEMYKSNAANVEDLAKVAAAIITKGLKFEDGNGNKVNRKLGETLKIVGEKAADASTPGNIKVTAKKSDTNGNANDTLEIGLSKNLTGIESITKGTNKAKLTLGESTASLESADNNSKIELKNGEIDLTTITGKTVKVKDNALEGVNKIIAEGGTNANSIDLANGNNKKNVVITAEGKQLTIAKDGPNGKEGISLTGLTDRKVDGKDYGINGNAGRAATEAAVLDLKTKGLTFAVNEKSTDSNPKTLKRELGETLKITGKDAVIENFDTTYSLDNIATKIDEKNNAIRIGLLKTPRFEALELGADSTKKISLTPDFANGNELKLTLTGTGVGAGNDTNVKISGVANGTGDNDAINKSQLNSVVTALGGNAKIGADGIITEPTYTLKNGKTTSNNEGEYKNIGEALTALDNAITKNNADADKLGEAAITFSDGKTKFTRKNSETDKKVEFKGGTNVTVTLDATTNTKKGEFTVSLNENLTGIKSIANDNTKISLKDKKITLSPEDGATLTLEKSGTDKVKISGLGDGQIADNSNDAITGKQLDDLAGKLGVAVNTEKTGFDAPSFTEIKGSNNPSKKQNTFKGAIEDLITAVNKGISFKGNDTTNGTATMQLGGTLTIDSSTVGNGTTTAEKDITASLTPSTNGDAKDAGTLTLTLNKAKTVSDKDEKVITSKAVAEKLKEYTTSKDLGEQFLKVDGSNINGKQADFGKNVGIDKIDLNSDKESTKLVQAKALVNYLKGTGEKSVKVSDSSTTEALGEGSISVGHGAISKNEGSIAMGYGANALNTGAVSIGQDSNVLGMSSIGIGRENTVRGNFSFAVGDNNVIEKEQNYVMGSDNKITGKQNISIGSRNEVEGNENIILGSNITADDEIHNAIVLGTGSLAKSNALSVGSMRHKRKIVFVADPTDNYDAANKKYVDERGLKFKGNESGQTEQLVNLDKLLTIDSSESKTKDGNAQEKDIKTSVTKDGNGAKLTLTLNKADEVSEHDERAVSSKAVHSALQAAKAEADKTAVKYDDPTKSSITLGGKSAKNYRPVAIDNLKSGLGIDDIKDVGITSAAQGKQGELVKDLVAGKLDTTKDARGKEIDNLHKAVNLADLKAVAQAGLNFAGNDEQDIHKNLGEKLDIVGQGLTKEKAADFKGTNGNIAVKADSTKTKLEVSLSEDLKGLKSAEFKGKDGNTVKIDGDAIVLNDKDGKPIATLNKDGLTINGKDGQSAVSLTTKNENGKDAATLAFAKGEDGQAGTGAITGLKDLADNADGSSATNKNYVDNQLKKAKEDADKTAVKYDDETRDVITLGGKGTSHKPVVIDNLRSGLGIDDINDGGIASIKQGKTRDLVKDLVAGKLDEKAHKAANVSDLKALATAGLNFAGNDAKDIHKNLGETLAIVGQGVTDIALFKGTNNNIAVKTVAGNLEVSLNEALTAIKSLVTQAKSVDDKSGLSAISTLDGAGLHLTPAESLTNGQGKQADYGLLGSTVKDGEKTNTQTAGSITLAQGDKSNTSTAEKEVLTAKDDQGNTVENTQTAKGNDLVKKSNNGKELASNKQTAEYITLSKDNGNTNVSTATETKLTSKDGETASLTAKGLTVGDSTKGGDKTHAVYDKTGFSVKGKDGSSEIVSLKVAEGQDGTGQSATLTFAKGADGKSGGTIKGLADIKPDETDGSIAANKNYVDEKVSDLDSNRPFDFYIQEGDDYTKVVKGRDGKFYKPEDLKGAKYVAGTADGDKGKYTKNDQDVKSSIADKQAAVVIKAEPTTSPMTITNVKDGDLTNTSTDAINGGQLVKATGAKFIDDPSSTTDPKAKKMVFADGKDGLSGLEKTSDGKEPMANKGLTAKDGLNGQNANDKANALRNGEAGAVVFTDDKGERLVKANDGKYYKAEDVEDNGTPKADKSAVDNPQLSLVNHKGEATKPVALGNVASGLGIDAEKVKQAEEEVKAKRSEAERKATLLEAKTAVMTQKEEKVTALKQEIENLSGDEKTQKEAELKAIEAELSQLNDELATATKDLKTANDALKIANNTLTNLTEDKIGNLVKGENINSTNGANIGDLQAVARAGLNFEGNDGVPVHKNLGEKLTIKGEGEFNSATTAAGNIKVEASETGLEVKLSDTLKNMTSFETREVDGKTSRLDSNGLKVVDKDSESVVTAQGTRIAGKGNHAGKSASYTLDGVAIAGNNGSVQLNTTALSFAVTQDQAGKPVGTGVIRGLKDLDAHATGDMAANKNYVDAKHHELHTQLSHTNREMRAGIAGALAAATLPNSVIPGKSMLAASAGSFKGHSAIALGYSKMSDNGKISIRLQGTSNSAGDLGGAVGVGYLW